MTKTVLFEISNLGDWNLFVIWPACAKPRLQKPCGGQALRRRQGGNLLKLNSKAPNLTKTPIIGITKTPLNISTDRNLKAFGAGLSVPLGLRYERCFCPFLESIESH